MKVFVKLFGGFRNYTAPGREGNSFWMDLEEGARDDLDKVREYMAEAGVDSLDVHLAIQNTEAERAVGDIIQANLAE